ncbi:hypothetical protein TIFTF001_012599 [Ficus carica]|uniref:Uncharacterized protein n=1 Tax=Ficus carica TaxID=3494 RepID=A0AA88D6E7_FICCA|nr:hypothetical protein TIFTF001_012599 [Ficus carica]
MKNFLVRPSLSNTVAYSSKLSPSFHSWDRTLAPLQWLRGVVVMVMASALNGFANFLSHWRGGNVEIGSPPHVTRGGRAVVIC